MEQQQEQEKIPTQGELSKAMREYCEASGALYDMCYAIIIDYMENCSKYFHVPDYVSKNIDMVHVDEKCPCDIIIMGKVFEGGSTTLFHVPTTYLWDLAEVAKEMREFRNGGEILNFKGI